MKDAQYVHREYLSLNTKFYLSLPSQLLSCEQRNEKKKTSKDSSNIWKMATIWEALQPFGRLQTFEFVELKTVC